MPTLGPSITRFFHLNAVDNIRMHINGTLKNAQVIPSPRSINSVKASLAKNKYKDALQAYEDLSLVFLNALFYNEDQSQIAKDASTLKVGSTHSSSADCPSETYLTLDTSRQRMAGALCLTRSS